MKSNRKPRFLALMLVGALLVQMLPTQAFATEQSNTTSANQAVASDPVTIVGEETTLRGEAEKHFRLSDGSYLAVTYGTPVHYQDNAGDWQDIDNRPIMATSVDGVASYQISNADKSTSFSSVLTDGTLFSTSAGDYSVSMHLLDTVQAAEQYRTAHMTADSTVSLNMSVSEEEFQVFSRNAVAEVEENVELHTTDEEQTGWKASDLMPDYLSSSIIYEDVFQDVDLRYNASGYNIKEEIIIYQPQTSYRYDFLLTMEGLTAQLNEDGSIDLLDENDVVIYEIPTPYMIDGAGEFSAAVEYSILEIEKGVILTVVADEEWINDSSREFPVIIDPSLNLAVYTSNNGEDLNMYISYVMESEPNRTAQGANPIYVGYGINTHEMTSYIYFNDLPTLPIGSFVTQATLRLYFTNYSNAFVPQMPLGIYEVTSGPSMEEQTYRDWIRFMTWNSKPDYDADNLIDYAVVSYSTVYTANGYQPVSWDMTELVKKWYCENTENRTIALGTTTQYTPDKCAVSTFSAYGSSTAPMLVVSYRNNTGIEPYYTYTTLGAGAAGAAYIADATGQIRIVNSLLGYSSNENPYTLGLVYNSDYFVSDAEVDYQPLIELGLDMTAGTGWRLNCVEKIVTENISGTTYLKYYDGDGTIHYFLPYNNAYYDEDGLGLKIVSKGNNAYDMTDDHGNKWSFTNSFLTTISDESGNQILIKYNNTGGDKLESIVQKNKNSAEIIIASFGYTDNVLTTVTDAAQNAYSFSYSGNKLISIAKNNTTIVQYGYSNPDGAENDNRIKQMIDTESGYQILLGFNLFGKVSSFQEYAGEEAGAKVDISYPNYSQTVYKDYGIRQNNEEDDILTYYLFDHAGRSVNAYTTDASGKILGASNAVYSGSGSTDKTNNRTMRTASIGVASQQLLTNSSFESSDGWTFESTRNATNPRTGQYALTLTQNVESEAVNLIGGKTYTFSAYVDTSAATEFNGRGIYLKVSGGEKPWETTPINYKTPTDNNWTRISVTFTAPTDGAYTLSICNDGVSGSVYADDVQLEVGEAPSNYNLLENGNFSMGKTGWVSPDTVVIDNGTLKITGSPNDATANASQTVQINLPSTETYVLSGWVTANAVPDTLNTASDPAQDTNKQCGLRAAIHYTDNSVEYHYVPFNTDLSAKQFVSYTIVPNPKDADGNPVVKTVSHIVVTCAYETNANIAYFDDISLVREVTQTMEYDENGNLKSVTTSGLNVDINTYEGGNLIKTITGSQGVFEYEYDETYTHRLTSVTQKDASTSDDAANNWITQSMEYDPVGNVISTTLSGPGDLTMSTSAEYTNNGNLLSSVTDATGATITYGYDSYIDEDNVVLTDSDFSRMMGLPTSVTAPNGPTTHSAYDLYGRITETSVADLATLVYNYSNGNLTSITRTAGNKSQTYSLQYDSFGKTTSISVGEQQLAAYEYMAGNGLLRKQTYGNGHEVSFTYDDLGRTKTVTHKDGPTLSYTYTGDGQLYSVTETLNGVSTMYLYQYDTLGNLVGSEKLVGGTPVLRTYHSYDADNRLSAQGWQIGSDSFSQTYSYDSWDGNLSSMVLSDNDAATSDISVSYSYDGLRRISEQATKYGEDTVLTEDYEFRTVERTEEREDGTTADVEYATSQVSKLTLDAAGFDCTYEYEYDVNGNITSVTVRNTATNESATTTYTYDAMNQLLRENNQAAGKTWVWTYDNAGNILAKTQYAYTTSTNTLGAVQDTVIYDYDDNAWGDLLTKYDGRTITHDEIGNPLSDGVWTYTWEHGRQLASMTSAPPVIITQQPEDYTGAVGDTATFTVSATGDGLTYQWQYSNDGGTIWSDSSASGNTTNTLSVGILAYRAGQLYRCVVTDAMGHRAISQPGQLIIVSGISVMSATAQTLQIADQPDDYYGIYGDTATFVVGAVGNGLSYQWEYSMTDGAQWWPSTAQGATTNTLTIAHTEHRVGYLYRCIITDASGNTVTSRNAEIKVATYGTWNFTYNADGLRTSRTNGSATYSYVYIGSQLSQMTVGNDVLYFAYDASGSPLAVTYNGTNYYYATNLQGDITAILDVNGTAVVEYTYDAWGNPLTTTGTMAETLGAVNPLRYRGYVYDTETGLYYVSSRYYDPEIGRFINADAFASTGQGIIGNNMFAYCGNNPVVRADPSGESFAIVLGFNFNLFGWGMIGTINLVSTEENFGVQYSYYISDDPEISEKSNQTIGVDVGPYVGVQYTDKKSMEELEGYAKATGGDLILGIDVLTEEDGDYLGWQFGSSVFSANTHSLYTNTETLFSVPTLDLVEIIVDWIFGEK